MTAEISALLHEIIEPPDDQVLSEAEADEKAAALLDRMEYNEAWEQAIMTGYQGPRGQHQASVPATEAPQSVEFTPIQLF